MKYLLLTSCLLFTCCCKEQEIIDDYYTNDKNIVNCYKSISNSKYFLFGINCHLNGKNVCANGPGWIWFPRVDGECYIEDKQYGHNL